jgi:hypothetical protein
MTAVILLYHRKARKSRSDVRSTCLHKRLSAYMSGPNTAGNIFDQPIYHVNVVYLSGIGLRTDYRGWSDPF